MKLQDAIDTLQSVVYRAHVDISSAYVTCGAPDWQDCEIQRIADRALHALQDMKLGANAKYCH